jgi:beta-lactamase regulating signal transducer with metallopeptidase domain
MNTLGIVLVWCIVQVTLVSLLVGTLYLVVRRFRPGAATAVVLTGLLTVVVLSALAFSPWPRWSWRGGAPEATSAAAPLPRGNPGDAAAVTSRSSVTPDATSEREVSSGVGPSMVEWWQSLLDEVSLPPERPAGPAWRWPAVVAAALLVSLAVGLAWLLVGLVAVWRYRVRSEPLADSELLELVDQVRAQLGCRQAVEVRQSGALVTAATIGWRRPLILLPTEWHAWTAAQRRAVMAHEIAHVVAGDFLATLCAQVAILLHFYHPLVHWLLRRLRLEQELLADAAAAVVSGGQQAYLTTIAELALRQEDRRLVWPARGLLPSRSAFLRRIVMLRDSRLRTDRLSPTARAIAVGVVLLGGLLVAGFRGSAAEPETHVAETASAAPATESPKGIDWSLVPVKGAFLVAAARPAAIFQRPELTPYGQLLDELSPVKVTEIEQVTWTQFNLPSYGPSPVAPDAVAILRMKKPNQFEHWLRECPDTEKREYRGKAYLRHEASMYPPQPYKTVLRLDDRTLAIATDDSAMRMYIQFLGSPELLGLPRFIDREQWKAFEEDQAVLAVRSATVDASINLKEDATRKRFEYLVPLAPL